MPGDAVSVLVLVEDSTAMVSKWPDVKDSYLSTMLEALRTTDSPSAQMDVRWLTASSARSESPVLIMDTAQAHSVPELPLGQVASATKLSPIAITHALRILLFETWRRNATRHLILVAATGPFMQGADSETTPAAFDPWQEIPSALQQDCIRLHVLLSAGRDMITYHELFKRTLLLQNNSEVAAWFPGTSNPGQYSIRLSGRPRSVRSSSAGAPFSIVSSTIPDDSYHNPSSQASYSTTVSPHANVPTLRSPTQTPIQSAQSFSHSPMTSPIYPRRSDSPQSLPLLESSSSGLLSYLQQMNGLAKKKSYGIKAPKQTYANTRLPNADRPNLPRPPQSDIYTYPSFPQDSEAQAITPDAQLPLPRRHSLVARTANGDRQARGRGPYAWRPVAPKPSPTASPSTLAPAFQSLSTRSRVLDAVGKDRIEHDTSSISPSDSGTRATVQSTDLAWSASPNFSAPTLAYTVSSSFRSVSRQFQTSTRAPTLPGSDHTHRSSPTRNTNPPLMPSPMSESLPEDYPFEFVVTPEYEAIASAWFEEAIRPSDVQAANMVASDIPAPSSLSYALNNWAILPVLQGQMFRLGQQAMSPQEASHATDYSSGYAGREISAAQADGTQADGAWPYPAANYHIPPSFSDCAQSQGQWYSW